MTTEQLNEKYRKWLLDIEGQISDALKKNQPNDQLTSQYDRYLKMLGGMGVPFSLERGKGYLIP